MKIDLQHVPEKEPYPTSTGIQRREKISLYAKAINGQPGYQVQFITAIEGTRNQNKMSDKGNVNGEPAAG